MSREQEVMKEYFGDLTSDRNPTKNLLRMKYDSTSSAREMTQIGVRYPTC